MTSKPTTEELLVMVGIKRSRPELITIGRKGEMEAGYSIGSQHLLHAAVRNEKVTLILVNKPTMV